MDVKSGYTPVKRLVPRLLLLDDSPVDNKLSDKENDTGRFKSMEFDSPITFRENPISESRGTLLLRKVMKTWIRQF